MMNRPTGINHELYFEINGPQISALIGRTDELLDGRVPRIFAAATPGQPAKLIDGAHTPASAVLDILRYEDVSFTSLAGAQAYADVLNKRDCKLADAAIKTTVHLAEIGRDISAEAMASRYEGEVPVVAPVTYEYATWAKASLRVAGGVLAICSATHLDGRNQQGDNANYEWVIDDDITRRSLSVPVADGKPYTATLEVETSRDLLMRQCVELIGFEAAQTLLNGKTTSEFGIEGEIAMFLGRQMPIVRRNLAGLARRMLKRALIVNQTRQDQTTHIDMPNQHALHSFCKLLRAQVL